MALPVGRVDVCVADWISTMDHRSIPTVNPHMADCAARIVSACEKDNIPRLCVRRRNRSTLVINALCRSPWQVMHPAVGEYPADKTGTVETCGRA